jgi:hypothetical protein
LNGTKCLKCSSYISRQFCLEAGRNYRLIFQHAEARTPDWTLIFYCKHGPPLKKKVWGPFPLSQACVAVCVMDIVVTHGNNTIFSPSPISVMGQGQDYCVHFYVSIQVKPSKYHGLNFGLVKNGNRPLSNQET